MPRLLNLLSFGKKGDSLLDVACGEGILSRHIPEGVKYLGIDASKSLIAIAKKKNQNTVATFLVQDVTKPFHLDLPPFTHASIVLALQNINEPHLMLKEIAKHLTPSGKLAIVLNHPCFRIPRQSSWEFDEEKKLQYRRIDRYMTPMQIPIQMRPSEKEKSASTLSFHLPLSKIFADLAEAGFATLRLEEWCSEKTSSGARAKAENRARSEFPLFLTLLCEKNR